jgi:hypothetical protein
MKYKIVIKWLLVVNAVCLLIGLFVIQPWNKQRQQEKRFLRNAETFAEGAAVDGGVSKQDALEAMLLDYRMQRTHRVSDKDLDRLLSIMESSFDKNKKGNYIAHWGAGLDDKLKATEAQKAKIARLCVRFATESPNRDARFYALLTIAVMNLRNVSSAIEPCVNDSDKEISIFARKLTRRFAKTTQKAI